jgi:hypothetical protein
VFGGESPDGRLLYPVLTTTALRKHRPFADGLPNGSRRPRSCKNVISDAGVARQRWLAPAGAGGHAAIACISGLTPKILIIRFIL